MKSFPTKIMDKEIRINRNSYLHTEDERITARKNYIASVVGRLSEENCLNDPINENCWRTSLLEVEDYVMVKIITRVS